MYNGDLWSIMYSHREWLGSVSMCRNYSSEINAGLHNIGFPNQIEPKISIKTFNIQFNSWYKFFNIWIWLRIWDLHTWLTLDSNSLSIYTFTTKLWPLSNLCYIWHKWQGHIWIHRNLCKLYFNSLPGFQQRTYLLKSTTWMYKYFCPVSV